MISITIQTKSAVASALSAARISIPKPQSKTAASFYLSFLFRTCGSISSDWISDFHKTRHEIGFPCAMPNAFSTCPTASTAQPTHLVPGHEAERAVLPAVVEVLELDPALEHRAAPVVPADAQAQRLALAVGLRGRALGLHAERRERVFDEREQDAGAEARVEARERGRVPAPGLGLGLRGGQGMSAGGSSGRRGTHEKEESLREGRGGRVMHNRIAVFIHVSALEHH